MIIPSTWAHIRKYWWVHWLVQPSIGWGWFPDRESSVPICVTPGTHCLGVSPCDQFWILLSVSPSPPSQHQCVVGSGWVPMLFHVPLYCCLTFALLCMTSAFFLTHVAALGLSQRLWFTHIHAHTLSLWGLYSFWFSIYCYLDVYFR